MVAGGRDSSGDKVTFYDNDGDGKLSKADTIVYYTAAGTNYTPEAYAQLLAAEADQAESANWYGSFGLSGLIGMSFEFGGNGLLPDWGDASFAVGVGAYADFGVASNQETAQSAAQGGDDYVFFGWPDGGISGDLGGQNQYIGWSGGLGIMATDDQDSR
jgi:hypothetical protein